MTDKPVITYVVSVFEKPHWRTVLTTKDMAKALAITEEIGDKVRVARLLGPVPTLAIEEIKFVRL